LKDIKLGYSEFLLSQTRFLRWNITPFLDNRLLDLSWVGSGPGADLLGDINTLLSRGKLGNKFGNVLASTLGLKRTSFLGGILNNSLGFVITFLRSLLESATSGGTELPWFLGTSGDGGVLLHILLGNRADLLGPLGALGVGGVSRGFILTFLLDLSLALNNVIFDIVNLLLGPALRLILSPADLRSLDITILHKRGSADLNSLVESDLLVLNETALSEVLLTLLLLLGLVVGDIGGVTSLVIRVITLHNIIILGFLNHLYFVNTSLAISTGSSSSNSWETDISIITLTSKTTINILGWVMSVVISMVTMVFSMGGMISMISMSMSISIRIEWKCIHQ